MRIGKKLGLLLCGVGLLTVGLTLVGLGGMAASNTAMRSMVEDRVVCLKQLKTIADLYAINIVDTSQKAQNGNISSADAIKNIEEAQTSIKKEWADYTSTYLTPEEKSLADQARALMDSADKAAERVQDLLKANEVKALDTFTIKELYPAIDPVSNKIGELVDLQLRVSDELYKGSAASFRNRWFWSVVLLVGGLLIITLGQLAVLQRTIVRPIASLTDAAELVQARADYNHRVPASGSDEVARLGQSFNAMMEAVRQREHDLRQLNLFQRTLIDNAAYGIVSSTPEGIVSSFNPAAERLLGYTADEVVGKRLFAVSCG